MQLIGHTSWFNPISNISPKRTLVARRWACLWMLKYAFPVIYHAVLSSCADEKKNERKSQISLKLSGKNFVEKPPPSLHRSNENHMRNVKQNERSIPHSMCRSKKRASNSILKSLTSAPAYGPRWVMAPGVEVTQRWGSSDTHFGNSSSINHNKHRPSDQTKAIDHSLLTPQPPTHHRHSLNSMFGSSTNSKICLNYR